MYHGVYKSFPSVRVNSTSLSLSHTNHTHRLTHSPLHTNRNIHTRHLYITHTPALCVITHTCIICTHTNTCACFVSHSNTHTWPLLTNAHTLPADVGVISEDCGDKVMLPLRIQVLPKCRPPTSHYLTVRLNIWGCFSWSHDQLPNIGRFSRLCAPMSHAHESVPICACAQRTRCNPPQLRDSALGLRAI